MTNNNTRTALADNLRPYYCHGCGNYVGIVYPEGTLAMPELTIVNCDALCPWCGEIVHWRRSDVRLAELVAQLTGKDIIAVCES